MKNSNRNLDTRAGKIALLKSIEQGKAAIESLIQPVWGVIYVMDGKVYRHSTEAGDEDINPPVDEALYKEQHKERYTHIIELADFSGKSK